MPDISIKPGETILLTFGPIVREGVAVDLNVIGSRLRFMVKRDFDDLDSAALFTATWQQDGQNVSNIAVPISGANNTGTITVPDDTTRDWTAYAPDDLPWELELREPGSPERVTVLDHGSFRLIRPLIRTNP